MRLLLLSGIPFLLAACGGIASDGAGGRPDADLDAADGNADASDSEPPVIVTGEVCKVDGDCKMDPGVAFCKEKTAIRYEIPTCGADQRCAWSRLENLCDLRCEDGYCITVR